VSFIGISHPGGTPWPEYPKGGFVVNNHQAVWDIHRIYLLGEWSRTVDGASAGDFDFLAQCMLFVKSPGKRWPVARHFIEGGMSYDNAAVVIDRLSCHGCPGSFKSTWCGPDSRKVVDSNFRPLCSGIRVALPPVPDSRFGQANKCCTRSPKWSKRKKSFFPLSF
jgi:hypothetical protein